MKRTTLFTLLLVMAVAAFAGPVTPEKAHEIAVSFWKKNAKLRKDVKLQLAPASSISKAPSYNRTETTDAQYYIFSSSDNNGFVIVSGDDQLTPVIGYSDNCNAGEMPAALKDMLAVYAMYVDDVRAGIVEPVMSSAKESYPRVEPLLETSWNQSAPYNNYCPMDGSQKTPTGCTATAISQVMKFHEWPEKPTKAITWTNNFTGKNETIDITQHTYDWGNMLPHYRDGYNNVQADAVAQLMVDVGKAIQSSYGAGGTGATSSNAARALVNVFDYSPALFVAERNEYTHEEYMGLIVESLQNREPLPYFGYGQNYAAGHAFVCDGIDTNGYLHIDWGWDGQYNGWFDVGSMSPGGTGIGGGQDRYNTGQAIMFGVHPRTAEDEEDFGEPTLYVFEANDGNGNDVEEIYIPYNARGTAEFSIKANMLNWSARSASFYHGLRISKEDGTEVRLSIDYSAPVNLAYEKAYAIMYTLSVNTTNPLNGNYLAKGTYNVEVYLKSGSNEPKPMRGDINCMKLVVDEEGATLTKAQPQLEVTGFKFRKAPEVQYDAASFDLSVINRNKHNALVVIVPIVNKLNGTAVVKSDTLVNKGVVFNAYENVNTLATYSISGAFAETGTYNITFAYDLRNSYTNHETAVDKKKLKSIAGASDNFVIAEAAAGPNPEVVGMKYDSNVVGENLGLTATVKNASAIESTYSATIGLLAQRGSGGETFVLSSADVTLSKDQQALLRFTSTDYYPAIEEGELLLHICELKGDGWESLTPGGVFRFELVAPETPLLYVVEDMVIGYQNITKQGDEADVIFDLGCSYADFDGYVRVNVSEGLKGVLRSEYIPVTLSEGDVVEVNLKSVCGSSVSTGKWNISIGCYDSNKRQVGFVSKNNLYYPKNGAFEVVAATDIEDVAFAAPAVTTENGFINVAGAAAGSRVNVYGVDGSTVYSGTATSIALEKGTYVVKVTEPCGSSVSAKVFVK